MYIQAIHRSGKRKLHTTEEIINTNNSNTNNDNINNDNMNNGVENSNDLENSNDKYVTGSIDEAKVIYIYICYYT